VLNWIRRLTGSDLSDSYADSSIAPKQRRLVDEQLQAMRIGKSPQHFQVVGRILSGLKEQTSARSFSLLDAGCGSGYYSEIIHHFVPGGIRYIGVDFNLGMLSMARQYYPGLPVARMDLRRLAVRDASVDLVMSGAAIVHIREWDAALKELTRVTRKWLLLHRTLVYTSTPTSVSVERHYEKDVYRVRISEAEFLALTDKLGMTLTMKCDAGEGPVPEDQENNTYLFERRLS
jgi:SAM-dependent methyltransferase